MSRSRPVHIRTKLIAFGLIVVLSISVVHWLSAPAYGSQLGRRQLLLSTNEVSASANYLLSFTTSTAGNIGSIYIQFCSNSPFTFDPCTAPVGMTTAGAAFLAETGITGFTKTVGAPNELKLTRPSAATVVTPASYEFGNIVNPSADGSYFARIQTYATSDFTGSASDYGSLAFDINSPLSISATVPPYLTFCAATTIPGQDCANAVGQYVDLGELSMVSANAGTSQMLVATNAGVGYGVTVFGPPMASGINGIASMAVNDISRPGTSQFGMNLVGNSSPAAGSNPVGPGTGVPAAGYNTTNIFKYVAGDTVVSHVGTEATRVYTTTYLVNVPSVQAPGIYVTTITYVALAKF